jgi:hypothetical protein
MDVTRRRFVGNAAAAGALVAAGGSTPAPADQGPRALRITLYDHRFAGAREEAQVRAAGASVTPVGGDVTDLLPALLASARAARASAASAAVVIQGITAESVPFCLAPALQAAGFQPVATARLTRDLFHWQFTSAT